MISLHGTAGNQIYLHNGLYFFHYSAWSSAVDEVVSKEGVSDFTTEECISARKHNGECWKTNGTVPEGELDLIFAMCRALLRTFLPQKICLLHAEAVACRSRYGFSPGDDTSKVYYAFFAVMQRTIVVWTSLPVYSSKYFFLSFTARLW